MTGQTIRLIGNSTRQTAKDLIDRAPDGYVCVVREETRSDDQNRKLHPMIRDVRQQVEGCGTFSEKDMRLRFLHALQQEAKFLPELDGNGHFPIGQSSATLSKSQFSALIEIIYEYGSRKGVRWSDPAERVLAEYGHGRKTA